MVDEQGVWRRAAAAWRVTVMAGSRPGRQLERWTDEDVRTALTTLAWCGGNTAEAARRLNAAGVAVPRGTLEGWKNRKKSALYDEIRHRESSRIQKIAAAQSEELALRYYALEARMVDELESKLPELRAADLSTALRNVEVARATSIDKARILRDQPDRIVETRNVRQILAELERLGVVDAEPAAIEATAEEVA